MLHNLLEMGYKMGIPMFPKDTWVVGQLLPESVGCEPPLKATGHYSI